MPPCSRRILKYLKYIYSLTFIPGDTYSLLFIPHTPPCLRCILKYTYPRTFITQDAYSLIFMLTHACLLKVSFSEYSLFYKALLQKRPITEDACSLISIRTHACFLKMYSEIYLPSNIHFLKIPTSNYSS